MSDEPVTRADGADGRPASHRFARVIAPATLAYLAVAVCFRPWYIRWGSSEREERMSLPAADAVTPEPSFQTTRSILIDAPPTDVWEWIVQLGQDRAGFYSYDWLERLAGFGVHNTNRVVPEWQHRDIGDLVRAAPPKMFGGLFGPNVGFRVAVFDSSRMYVVTSPILNWSFVLEPIDEHRTRLIVRARGDAHPGPKNYVLSLLDFFAVGPAHFIMEHKLLLTLKERSEATARTGATAPVG